MSTIRFKAKLFKIGSWNLLRLPESASAELPSRGVTMVDGTINGFSFQAALEPGGRGPSASRFDCHSRWAGALHGGAHGGVIGSQPLGA